MSKFETVTGAFGATIKHTGEATANLPARIATIEAACKEAFGPDGIKTISVAAGLSDMTQANLQNIAALSFALGYAHARGGKFSTSPHASTSVPSITKSDSETWLNYYRRRCAANGENAVAEIEAVYRGMDKNPPATTSAKKDFNALVVAKVATGISKTNAISAVAKEFPALHGEFIASGKPLQF